jgi:hypothetical protein
VVLNWNDPGAKGVEIMYKADDDPNDMLQVSVKNRSGKQFQFEIRLSPVFLLNRFGRVNFE